MAGLGRAAQTDNSKTGAGSPGLKSDSPVYADFGVDMEPEAPNVTDADDATMGGMVCDPMNPPDYQSTSTIG